MDIGRRITDLEQMESVPAGSSYLVEAGDGSGSKQIKHEKLVEEVGKGLNLGNLKELETESKGSIVGALNEVNEKAGTVFKGTDSMAKGAAGLVPAPQPEDEGKVLGANGKWVPNGGTAAMDVLADREELEANTEEGKLVDALVVKEISENLGGFSFYHEPMIVYTIDDSTPYTDENGGYVLSNSATGQKLLADADTYTSMVISGDYRSIGGADTVVPFSGNVNFVPFYQNVQKAVRGSKTYNVKDIPPGKYFVQADVGYSSSNNGAYGGASSINITDGIIIPINNGTSSATNGDPTLFIITVNSTSTLTVTLNGGSGNSYYGAFVVRIIEIK